MVKLQKAETLTFTEAIESPELFYKWSVSPTPLTEKEDELVKARIEHEVEQCRMPTGTTVEQYLAILKQLHFWFDMQAFADASEKAKAAFELIEPQTSRGEEEKVEMVRFLNQKREDIEHSLNDLERLRWELFDLKKTIVFDKEVPLRVRI
jgi:hypothetical protein